MTLFYSSGIVMIEKTALRPLTDRISDYDPLQSKQSTQESAQRGRYGAITAEGSATTAADGRTATTVKK